MHRFATVSAVLLGLGTVGTGAALTAPEQTRAAGLDFWHMSDEATQLQAEVEERQDLEFKHEQMRQRNAASLEIAANLCEDRIGAREALECVAALAECDPEWFTMLRVNYHTSAGIRVATTDHEVMVRYLRVKIEQLVRAAQILDDAPRATALSARLVRFDSEVPQLSLSSPALAPKK